MASAKKEICSEFAYGNSRKRNIADVHNKLCFKNGPSAAESLVAVGSLWCSLQQASTGCLRLFVTAFSNCVVELARARGKECRRCGHLSPLLDKLSLECLERFVGE